MLESYKWIGLEISVGTDSKSTKMSLICGEKFFSFVLHMKKMPKAFINIMRILQPLLTNCQTSVLKYCREIFQRNISLIYESRY